MMSAQISNEDSRVKKKMKCCVKYCEIKASKDLEISFHQLPKPNDGFVKHENYFGKIEKISRLKAWQMALCLGENYSRSLKVCSSHFRKNDYLFPDAPAGKRYLKKTAVPSLKLPVTKKETTDRSRRMHKRQDEKLSNAQKRKIHNQTVIAVESSITEQQEINVTNNKDLIMIPPDIPNNNNLPKIKITDTLKKDAENKPVTNDVLIETDKFTVISFIKSDSELSTMTGLQSFTLLNTIVEILKKCYGSKVFEKSSLNARDKVVLTYMKMKQNMSYSVLAILFQMSAKHCQRIFTKTLVMLKKCLKVMIDWPSITTISRNLPLCFKGYEDVRVILDCTEIHIQHNKCLECQMSTFSQYKGGSTAKFITGVSPLGSIIYVSKMYGGKASDTDIFKQSELIQLLERGDGIMVNNKGFLIEGTCEKNGWKLYRPSYLRDKQPSKDDADQSWEVSKARVHIKRSNQRLKVFQILSSTVPCELHPLLEDIFIVICATVNLSSPIIADSNFMKNPGQAVIKSTEMELG